MTKENRSQKKTRKGWLFPAMPAAHCGGQKKTCGNAFFLPCAFAEEPAWRRSCVQGGTLVSAFRRPPSFAAAERIRFFSGATGRGKGRVAKAERRGNAQAEREKGIFPLLRGSAAERSGLPPQRRRDGPKKESGRSEKGSDDPESFGRKQGISAFRFP